MEQLVTGMQGRGISLHLVELDTPGGWGSGVAWYEWVDLEAALTRSACSAPDASVPTVTVCTRLGTLGRFIASRRGRAAVPGRPGAQHERAGRHLPGGQLGALCMLVCMCAAVLLYRGCDCMA